MPFTASWRTVLDECEELAADATLITPLSETRFRITDVQEHRIVIEFVDSGTHNHCNVSSSKRSPSGLLTHSGAFDLQRLPPDAEPYAAVLSLHPRYEIDDREGTLTETDEPTTSQFIKGASTRSDDEQNDTEDRTEPDLDVYADMLLLIDALERHDPTELKECETPALINLYTLLSDVQRNAGDLRQDVREVLLGRLHHDQPVHGQYGSVQRTSRRNRSLKTTTKSSVCSKMLASLASGLWPSTARRSTTTFDVTDLSESAVYEIETSEYVRKADVDEEHKETRLQGLKDQLALSDDPDAEKLRQEVDELEQRIEELTEFKPGTEIR